MSTTTRAAIINATNAVNRASEVGSLEICKRADIIVVNAPNHRFLGYSLGVNLIDKVIKNGRVVIDKKNKTKRCFLAE